MFCEKIAPCHQKIAQNVAQPKICQYLTFTEEKRNPLLAYFCQFKK
jgi:hypothetical protein